MFCLFVRMHRLLRKNINTAITNLKPSLDFDSASAVEMIGSKPFDKFSMTAREFGKAIYNASQLSLFYKGYKYIISYRLEDIRLLGKLEKNLLDSEFSN